MPNIENAASALRRFVTSKIIFGMISVSFIIAMAFTIQIREGKDLKVGLFGVEQVLHKKSPYDNPTDPNRTIYRYAPGLAILERPFLLKSKLISPFTFENITLSESAENSATRMFVVGDNNDLGSTASALYSAAADNDLLKAGWPLLDRSEKATWPIYSNVLSYTPNIDNWGNYDAEADFYLTAQRYLYESKPPQGDFIVRVDGSLSPIIGTYNPGDWCQIVVNDESGYINARLNSVLEPRHDVIVRKIDNIKVSVPNSPAFPEEIDLTLVTDWQVDKIGK